MRNIATILFGLVLFSSPALATDPDILINGGTMDFDYVGTVGGHFGSNGSLVEAPVSQGTAATTYVLDGLNYLVVVGALEDGANFVDGGILILSSVAPLTTGVFPLDGVSGVFLFIDDAVGWTPPADLFNTNWTNELAALVASGKYGSTSGSVHVTALSPSQISGTFTAAVADPVTSGALTLSEGSFNVETTVSTDAKTWGEVKALHR